LENHGSLLDGCREIELTALSSDDALHYMQAAGIHGSDGDIRRVAASYGNHPLSLAILAGWLLEDLRQPGDIAAAQRLTITNDLVQNQHHVLEAAYQSLSLPRRVLLSRIACFRSAVTYDTLHAAAEQTGDTATLDADLRALRARGLLQQHKEEGAPRFDLHPIVRRYAYERLGQEERQQAHTVLIGIFEAFSAPERVQRIEELTPQIELYHHLLHAGRYDEAFTIFRGYIDTPTYYQFGAYDLQIDLLRGLFPDGEDRPPRLSKEGDQAEAISMLAVSYAMSGQPHRATRLLEHEITLHERRDDKRNLAIGLGNLANRFIETGQFRAAEANLRRSIALYQELGDAHVEAVGHQELGRLLAYAGRWQEAEDALATALRLFEQEQKIQSQGIVWAYRALLALLQSRASLASSPLQSSPPPSSASSPPQSSPPALAHAQQALALADETARTRYPHERDYVRAHWLLGAAHLASGDLPAAERHLGEALTRCRGINNVEHEPNILIELARLRLAQGNPAEAQALAAAAQGISERSGYAPKEADARLVLARLAQQAGNAAEARQQAAEARRLATCDGPPDHTYYAAYVEAEALLENTEGL
jgi:tetratricopeptide (TPR) repeat protein